MNTRYLFLLILTLYSFAGTAEEAYQLTGRVFDSLAGKSLGAATIVIKGTGTGALSNDDGTFSFKSTEPVPFTLVISAIGYKTQEFIVSDYANNSISISLYPIHLVGEQVVVSASRVSESLLKSPVSIEKLDIRRIKESPAPTFFDALEGLKGVQMTTLSLTYKVPNARGFSSTTNSRFLQMVDGVDNISSGIGAPVGNAVGPTELDIESVELIPGASSALYGLNAVSGISNMKTKSPFKYAGISVYQKTGLNHVGDNQSDPQLLTETAVRYAKVIGNKIGFKVNASYSQGYDGFANNLRDQNPDANASVGLTGPDNPGKDLINVYGDEGSNRRTLSLNGKNYVVSRTGYREKDIADYTLKNLKADASLHYKIDKQTELSYTYRIGQVSNLYQRGNRIRLDGLTIQQHSAELKGQRYYLKGYYTVENTGKSYNLRPLAENLDLAFKSNDNWFSDYRSAYLQATAEGHDVSAAHKLARERADDGRYVPGTSSFEEKKAELIKINNWDKGAALVMNTSFAHLEGQYEVSSHAQGIQTLVGFNYRQYQIVPDGNSYVNPASIGDLSKVNEPFTYYSYGGFIQFTKHILNERLKLVGSTRIDKVQYFEPKLNPRLAVVYTFRQKHNVRLSYQNGFRFPTLFESFSFVDNGGVKRLGGLQVLAEPFGLVENSYVRSSQDKFIKAVNEDVNKSGLSVENAIERNRSLLKKSRYGYIKPERINSFEIGYKASLLQGRLFLDADYYYNIFNDFIGQVELTQPNKGTIGVDDSTVYAVYNKSSYKIYRLWTNSTSIVSNHGATIGLQYNVFKKFNISANAAYAALVNVSEQDALIPAFNTPKWIVNASIGNSEVLKNTGFNVTYRWQSAFDWQSPLANGRIPAYATFSAQVTYRIPSVGTSFKVGASNLFNNAYYQYEGGPNLGGLYYLTVIFDHNSIKK